MAAKKKSARRKPQAKSSKSARPPARKASAKKTGAKGPKSKSGIVYSDVRREALIRRLVR